MFGLKHLHWYL